MPSLFPSLAPRPAKRRPGGLRAADLFAGAGGSSCGLEAAGYRVLWAANHWAPAVAVHAANHPATKHVCQDLQQADFGAMPEHDLLWASPSCKGHSTAASGGGRYRRRGSAPAHDWLRATAWAVVTAAEVQRPRAVVVENVELFARWRLLPAWRQALETLGYALSWHTVNAADVGVPQDRPRVFVIGLLEGPALELGQPQGPRRAMGEVLQVDAGQWRPVRDCPPGVKRRVARAIERRGFPGAFHTQSVSDNSGRSLDRPAPVVTTKHQHGLVRGSGPWRRREYRPLLLDEYRALMGFPETYDMQGTGVSQGVAMLGNAVCPAVAQWIGSQVACRLSSGSRR